jgi:hypothetical protein
VRVSDERHEEEVLQSAVSAGLLRGYAGDREMFLKLLAQGLEEAVPERVEIERTSGWFGRDRTIRRLRVDLDEYRYQLEVGKGGALTPTRTRVVRGIALKTENLPMEEWLGELSQALVEYSRTHAVAMDALKRRVW